MAGKFLPGHFFIHTASDEAIHIGVAVQSATSVSP